MIRVTLYHRAPSGGCPHLHVRDEYARAPLPSTALTAVALCLDCGNAICVVVELEAPARA